MRVIGVIKFIRVIGSLGLLGLLGLLRLLGLLEVTGGRTIGRMRSAGVARVARGGGRG